MAILTDLPAELLGSVYHELGSIDDVHSFARSCKRVNGVIQRHTVYVDIMRSVISKSPHHRFDIQLCRMLYLHQQLVQHFHAGGNPIRPSPAYHQIPPYGAEDRLMRAVTDNSHVTDRAQFTDSLIHDILARWQGLRLLQDLWLTRQLADQDYLPINHSWNEDTFGNAYATLLQRDDECFGRIPISLPGPSHWYTSFNSYQVERFYAAVTKSWLMNEIRWVLAQFVYPSNNRVPLRILDQCIEHIKRQTVTPLLDHLDQWAVYTFLYQHLLPLHSPALADQCSSKLPLTFSSELNQDQEQSTRFLQLFLLAGQTYLQPPDIIDLVVRNRLMQKLYRQFYLPQSTLAYIHPSNTYPFPPNRDLASNDTQWPSRQPLASQAILHFRIMQRATVAQSAMFPTPDVQLPTEGLYRISDSLYTYFHDQCEAQFHMYARPDREHIGEILEYMWKKHTRWQIWWWANSEEKARAKMERWRME